MRTVMQCKDFCDAASCANGSVLGAINPKIVRSHVVKTILCSHGAGKFEKPYVLGRYFDDDKDV